MYEEPRDKVLSIRVSSADRELIAARARSAGLSQGQLILRAVLALPVENELGARVASLEKRVERLEQDAT